MNDTIFSFWGFSNGQEVGYSERYVIRENKWKQILGKDETKEISNLGPAALLYE